MKVVFHLFTMGLLNKKSRPNPIQKVSGTRKHIYKGQKSKFLILGDTTRLTGVIGGDTTRLTDVIGGDTTWLTDVMGGDTTWLTGKNTGRVTGGYTISSMKKSCVKKYINLGRRFPLRVSIQPCNNGSSGILGDFKKYSRRHRCDGCGKVVDCDC